MTLDHVVEVARTVAVTAGQPRARSRGGATSGVGLTPREQEVLRLVAAGQTDREIAQELFISRRTVIAHVQHIFGKLGVDTRTAAATMAVRQGLI